MKRIYYGSAIVEVRQGDRKVLESVAILVAASGKEEATGKAFDGLRLQSPDGIICELQVHQIPDEYVRSAAEVLEANGAG